MSDNNVTPQIVPTLETVPITEKLTAEPKNAYTSGDINPSEYDIGISKFPSDLGGPNSYNSHIMMININVPYYSPYRSVTDNNGQPVSIYNNRTTPNFTFTNALSRMDTYRNYIDPNFKGSDGLPLKDALDQNFKVARRTRRIKEAIQLYMPSTVAFTNTNNYENISLTDMAARGISGAFSGAMSAMGKNAAGVMAGGLIGAGASAAQAAARLNNSTINPRVEVLYTSTQQRQFDFTFLFAPASQEESDSLRQIIKVIRFHSAAETNNRWGSDTATGTAGIIGTQLYAIPGLGTVANWLGGQISGATGGVIPTNFVTPPSEFDISFYHTQEGRLVENTYLPRISTCALQAVDVDYAPTGAYATFSNGHSVHVRLTLRFQELEVIDKLKIVQGF